VEMGLAPPSRPRRVATQSRAWQRHVGARLKNGVVTSQGIINGKSDLSAADKAALARPTADGRYYTMGLSSLHGDYQLRAVRSHDGDVLITGLPLAGMDLTLYRVELAELIAFSAAC
jgi:two-component system OmpR family sensor kinase